MRHATLCKFSGTFHSYVMLRYCKFSGTFHSCVMPRYCKFSGTFHSYVMLRYCKFSGTFHSCVMPRYCKFSGSSMHTSCYVTVSSLELSTHASCHAIVSSLGRTRSVAVTNTGIKTCQVEYFENSHKPQKWQLRLGKMLVLENMHQNKGLTANGLKNHIKTCQVELVWEFSKTSKMVVSSRRNACFWKYAPE